MKDLQIGNQLEQEGKIDKAIDAYNRAVKVEPKSVEAHHHLAKALKSKGYWNQAIAAYQKLAELRPENLEIINELGTYLISLGYKEKAIDLYKETGEVLAKSLALKKELETYISVYQEAIKIGVEPQWFHLYIGDVYSRQGDLENAINSYLKAIEIAPKFWEPHDRILLKVQREPVPWELLEKMIDFYQEVIRKCPDYLLAYSNLGDILTKLGRKKDAINCYQTGSYRQNSILKPRFVEQAWDSTKKGQQPKFIIIGSMRCGTTSLYEYLTYHPQFVPALKKEVKFFNFNYESGKDWYKAHFPSILEGSGYITGEGSPDHLYYPEVATKIKELFPDMKLIVMLRNPVERSISQYYHWVKVGAEYRSLEKAIADEIELIEQMASPNFNGVIKRKGDSGCLLESVYIHFLEKWMSVIPKEQFLIIKSEDFYANTADSLRQVYDFIGLPDYQLPEYKTYNANAYDKINKETYNTLEKCFLPHNQKLEEFLGMKFDWNND